MNLTSELVEATKKNYKCLIEKPWKRYPEYITIKDEASKKWFALFMDVSGDKLGLDTDEILPIVNIKAETEFIAMLSNSKGFFPGYHMNKENWISILLDGTVPYEQLLDLIDVSYNLVTDSPTKRIYEAVKKIPKGKVATYGQIAAMAGNPKMSRAVGNALHKNPDENGIPCYRVVNSKGELAEAFVFGGKNIQEERLRADGIEVVDGRVDLKKYSI